MSKRSNRGLRKGSGGNPTSSSFGWGYSRKSRTDWKGVGIGDAFKKNLDYCQRIPAQRLFYRMIAKAQALAAAEAGVDIAGKKDLPVKAQLSPCYTTSFPANLSVWAAVGETAFLTYSHFAEKSLLQARMKDWLKNPAGADRIPAVDSHACQVVALTAVKAVEARFVMDDLARVKGLESVETFRLFLASHYGDLSSLQEMIRVVILFGDVLPDWRREVPSRAAPSGLFGHIRPLVGLESLHRISRAILEVLEERSRPFFQALGRPNGMVPTSERLETGERWVREIFKGLLPFLPLPAPPAAAKPPASAAPSAGFRKPSEDLELISALEQLEDIFDGESDGPRPPTIEVTDDPAKVFAATADLGFGLGSGNPSQLKGEIAESPAKALLKKICQTIQKAVGQAEKHEDMRADLVEQSIRANPFEKGAIEGTPTEGSEISVTLGGETMTGQVFDRPLPLSEDLPALDSLKRQAAPVIEVLRRNLYPNLDQVFDPIRFQVGGRIDPSRLHSFQISPAIYQRFQVFDEPDPRGSPLLLLTCDASGSLSADQMCALKLLSASWLDATTRSDIRILAGTYTSDHVRPGVCGPVVSWIFHPRKTPCLGKQDAIRAVVTLPDNGGTGGQSDVISLSFMLNEARALARGGMVYLVMLTDCCWNKSFSSRLSGVEEMQGFFQDQIDEFGCKLNITLCALGAKEEKDTGLAGLADKIILLKPEELRNPLEVSRKISEYVASCFRERRAFKGR